MAVRQWSSEYVSAEHRDLAATSCSLDREGRLAVLAGRRCLALIDLDQPQTIVKKISRQSRWEAGPVEWNPGQQHHNHLAAVCHDKVEIYVWHNNDFVISDPIRAHTRSVSDIHWNPQKPTVLASSSPDGYIHCWDLRDLQRPAQSFCNLVGANYIRWNRHNSHVLATAHDGDVKVWDARQGASPVSYISAHLSRLHSLDWSYKDESKLVTASSDCTVKFHVVGPGKSKDCTPAALSTAVPVWRARHTPFGEGLVTVLVPHLSRQEHSLFLWNVTNLTAPVHSFFGHRDVILDFDWRRSGPEYQMVTWSKDQSLRIWNLDQETQYRCGLDDAEFVNSDGAERSDSDDIFDQALEAHEASFVDSDHDEEDDDQNTVRCRGETGEFPRSWSGDRESLCGEFVAAASVREHSPRSTIENTLQQEFALLDTNYTMIRVTELDIDKRVCKVTSSTAHCKINLAILFPQMYPRNTSPTFSFLKGTSLNPGNKNRILKSLKATANQQVKRNRACLERCLRQLESQLEQISQEATVGDEATKSSFPFATNTVSDYSMGMGGGHVLQGFRQSFQDSNIPYPRTSGARFCGNGHLVCFGRPAYQKKVQNSQCPGPTPRTYSAYLAPDPWKTSSFYPPLHLASSPTRDNYDFTSESLPFVQERQLNVVKRGRFRVRQVGSVEDGQLRVQQHQGLDRQLRTQPAPERQLRTQPAQDRVMRTQPAQDRVLRTMTAQERQLRAKKSGRSRRESTSSVSLRVTVYNVSGLMPLSRDLAVNYIVSEDPIAMCQHNVAKAAEAGRAQLVQVWKLVLQVLQAASQPQDDAWGPWALCPMGSKLVRSVLEHHLKCWDLQTVAMLICALTKPTRAKAESVESGVEPLVQSPKDKFWFLRAGGLTGSKSGALTGSTSSGDSPYHTIHSVSGMVANHKSETTLEHFFAPRTQKSLRSNSWTETLQDSSSSSSSSSSLVQAPTRAEARYELLGVEDIDKYSPVLLAYSDILYRWGLILQRTSLMKHCSTQVDKYLQEKVGSLCPGCGLSLTDKSCTKCSTPALTCSICRLPVLGLSVVCPSCGHGGHLLHVKQWAETHQECSTGCGCKCHNLV